MLVIIFSENSQNKLIIQASEQYRRPGAQTLRRMKRRRNL